METQKKSENNIVLEMKRLLGRMMVQVDYMYRNDREISRLDLDILMERTRDFYDLLCDYQSNKMVEEVVEEEHVSTEINEGGELINRDTELQITKPKEVLNDEETIVEKNENVVNDEVVETQVLPEEEQAPAVENPVPPTEEQTPTVEETVSLENEGSSSEDEEDWEDEEDEIFHVEPVEEVKDNSLAAQLQRKHVQNIRTALGINDKMMIINDLFKGSVERCNKSIDALNDFPTLSGAKVYMNELQIELQWDVKSQAYKILNDLVERRFI